MTDNKTKQNYIDFFKNRTASSSDKTDYNTLSELDLEKIISDATKKADTYEENAKKQREQALEAQNALNRIRNKNRDINPDNNQSKNTAHGNYSPNYVNRKSDFQQGT